MYKRQILTPEDFESTRNTELAACLITLGFPLLNSTPGFSRVIGEGIAAPGGAVTWWFEKRSRDGKYTMDEVLARWEDWNWLNDPNNLDPLAYIITGFHNRRRLIDEVKQQAVMVLVRTGARYALFSKNSSRSTLDRVEKFMGY
ncbi:hypothetical protein [uncultured Akkermansia sp.]|uniref:hypothetical protein n=1 Tax=uncultured Akkermansia sp. TaxID=512294 RepID=UPI00259519EE|nr:hypothetical protein [uncultured Akkermansia sp.]